jgi:hypothetical protein
MHNSIVKYSFLFVLGVIPGGSSLECEFVCLPSYDCPSAAQFFLAVGGKDSAPATGADSHVLTLLPKVNIITNNLLTSIMSLNTVQQANL